MTEIFYKLKKKILNRKKKIVIITTVTVFNIKSEQ